MKTSMLAALLLLAAATPALAAEWVSFSMGEGPDVKLDRSSIRRDAEGAIAAWDKGWMTAKTISGQGSHTSPGYFVTDCGERYAVLKVNPKTGSVEDRNAQPLQVRPGTVALQMQTLVCGNAK